MANHFQRGIFWGGCIQLGILLAPNLVANAQNTQFDSLRTVADKAVGAEERYNALFFVAAHSSKKYPDIAAAYIDSALAIANSAGRRDWVGRAYGLKGNIAQSKGDLPKAVEWQRAAARYAVEGGFTDDECMSLCNLAAVYVEMGEMDSALLHYRLFQAKAVRDSTMQIKRAKVAVQLGLGIVLKNQNKLAQAAHETELGLQLAKQYGTQDRFGDLYENLAKLYGRMGDQQAKLDYLRKATALMDTSNAYIATAWNNLGNVFIELGALDSADFYYQKVIAFSKTKWKSLIHAYNGLSQVCFERGDYEAAYAYALKSLPLAEKTENPMTLVLTRTKLGNSLIGLKQYPEAIKTFEGILQSIETNNKGNALIEERAIAKRRLAQALALQNGLSRVARLIDEFVGDKDSIHNFEVTQSIELFRIRFETLQKEDSIRLLKAQQQLQAVETARYKMGFWGGGALLLALSGLFFYILRQRRLEKEVLKQQNDILRGENRALFEAKEQQARCPSTLYDFADTPVVLNGNEKTVFRIGDIFYIQSQGNGVQVTTPEGKHWRWQTLKNLEDALPSPPFVKIHRSFLVNAMHIRQYKTERLTLSNGETIPVGGTLRHDVEAFLRQWLPELA